MRAVADLRKVRFAVEKEAQPMLEQVEVLIAPRRIGQQHGHDDAYAEHYPGRLFSLDELLQRHYEAAADFLLIFPCHDLTVCETP